MVLGLLRQGKLHFLPALRQALLIFLKEKIKGIVAGYLQEEEEEEGKGVMEEPPSLADIMRGMSFEAWLAMLSELFERVLHFQKAIKVEAVISHYIPSVCIKVEAVISHYVPQCMY